MRDVYLWAHPLVTVHRTLAAQAGGAGCIIAKADLATAADRLVVAPNNDTLYSSGWFDLRDGDLTVAVGGVGSDRYWSVMLIDAYTHVKYVCRRLHGSRPTPIRVTLDPNAGEDDPPGVVRIATPTVWVLIRVLVSGPEDLAAARAARDQIHVRQGDRDAGGRDAPSTPTEARGPAFFAQLASALAVDPPGTGHPPPPPAIDEVLSDGIDAGLLAEGARSARQWLAERGPGIDRRGNGWGTRVRGANFGDDFRYRAAFAHHSLAGHLPAENRSYSRRVGGASPVSLRFRQHDLPPVDGFWSLTVYGPDLFFVDNVLDRYSIGDRTPGLRRDPDGSLTVHLGPEPPATSANWLPTPAGPYFLALRAYEGAPAVVDATWFPPDLSGPQVPGADEPDR